MRPVLPALALSIVLGSPAIAANHAFASGQENACGTYSSSSGAVSASTSVSTPPYDGDDGLSCFPRGGVDVSSAAAGLTGSLSGSGDGGEPYADATGNWGHSLQSTVKFLSGADATTVTFRLTGFASAFAQQDYYSQVGAFEQLGLTLTGAFGNFSDGFTVSTGADGFDQTIGHSSGFRDFTFKFSGPQAIVDVLFWGYGGFDVSEDGYGGGAGGGRLTILTDHGAFVSEDNVFGGVPEPASWAMMLTGFAAIGAALRRRPNCKVTFARP